MAHTKSAGSTKLGRDSESKRLGVKKQDGEAIKSGQIIIRQRGTKYHPGKNVRRGNDDTLFSTKEGKVKFYQKMRTRFEGKKKKATMVEVI